MSGSDFGPSSMQSVCTLFKRVILIICSGAPAGLEHCDVVGCAREGVQSGTRHELCRAVHAEQNAIIQAALHGVSVEGGTVYVTHQPCITCAKMIINSGIVRAVCASTYPDDLSRSMLDEADVALEVWETPSDYCSNDQEG